MHTLLLFLTLIACGSGPYNPVAEDYDQTCSTAQDCAPVVVLGNCGCSCSQWAAVNVSELTAYNEAQQHYIDKDPCREYCLLGCYPLADESDVTAFCDGTCAVSVPDTGQY